MAGGKKAFLSGEGMKRGADSPKIGNSSGSLCRVVEDADPYGPASQSLRGAQNNSGPFFRRHVRHRQNGLAPRRSRAMARRLCIRAPILPLQIKALALIW